MANIDQRIVRVGIEINGELRVYENLYVTASGTKFANPLQNECEIKIANLSKEVRDYLLTETSPFNTNKTPKRIIIDAGRVSTGPFRLYEGDITECVPSQAPDIILTMKAKTGQFSKGNVVAVAQASQVPLSRIAKDVADSLALTLIFEAKEKNISNYSFTGGALKQVEKLSEAGQVNAYVDDKNLIVKDYNVPLRGVSHVLSAETGMIGLPEMTEQGIKVKYLLDPKSQLGGQLTVESEINKALSGDYVIYKLSFDISSRDVPFYWIAEAKRKGAK
jgi:hypothetical protein